MVCEGEEIGAGQEEGSVLFLLQAKNTSSITIVYIT